MQIEYFDIHTHGENRPSVRAIRNYSAIERPAFFAPLHSVGLHPYEVSLKTLASIDALLLSAPVAIGETGLDYACGVDRALQRRAFELQVSLAETHRLPLIVHSVHAVDDTLAVLSGVNVPVVIHGFTGHYAVARRFLDRGYYLSFGARTLGSPKTIEALKSSPRDRVFFETDAAQVEISELYTIFAELLAVEKGVLGRQIANNFNTLFNL